MTDRRIDPTPGNPLRWLVAVIGYGKKALVAAAGICSALVAGQLVHGSAAGWCQFILALATIAGVYRVNNGPRPSAPRHQDAGRP